MGFVGFFLQFFVMQFFSSQAWTFHGVISCCSFKRFKMHARYSQGLWEKGLKSLYLKTYQPRKEGGWELKCKFQWMFAKTRISDLVLQMWKGKCYFRKRPRSVPSYPSMETRYRKEKEWRLWGKYRANQKITGAQMLENLDYCIKLLHSPFIYAYQSEVGEDKGDIRWPQF